MYVEGKIKFTLSAQVNTASSELILTCITQ